VVVSIDTEEDNWDPARGGITVENIRELVRLDRFFERLGVRATYFTTHQVAITPWAGDILRGLHQSGRAEVGAHLHPWNTPPIDLPLTSRNTMLVNLPEPVQVAKIETITKSITRAIGRRPTSFRAGRWGFGRTTANALLTCGYQVDSSVTPFKNWWEDDGPTHRGAPLEVYRLDGRGDSRVPVRDGPLIEVPLSWGYARGLWSVRARVHDLLDELRLRHLRLESLAARLHLVNQFVLSPEIAGVEDMVGLSRRLLATGVRHLHVSWHSPSLRPGLSPFITTRADVERLYTGIEEYFARLQELVPIRFATVSEAAALLAPGAGEPRPTPPPRATPGPAERRLVVLSYHFPPDPAIGGLRWSGLTKYLFPLGWRSWVVTAGAPSAPAADGTPGVTVESPSRRKTLNDLYLRLRHRTAHRGQLPEGSNGNGGGRQQGGWLSALRNEGGVLLALPDEGRGWILRAARCGRRLINRVRPAAVVSSGPPHSVHLAAWLATRFTRTRWFVDMRDPWAGPITDAWVQGPFYRSLLGRRLIAWLERLVITSATGVLCNTREFADALAGRYPGVRIEWVPNAVDRELLPAVAGERFPGLNIVHVGTIYGGRNLGPVLEALRMFLDRYPEARSTRLRIAGQVEAHYEVAIRQQIAALRLEPWVELLGVVPRRQALELVARSQLALVLAQHQEYQVPAKLYELGAMGVPTVVIASPGSAAAAEGKRLGASVIASEDVAGLLRVMEHADRGAFVGSVVPENDYRHVALRIGTLLGAGLHATTVNVPPP
jgi:glycosyltransferase involved in cell wall biosynthesis